MEDEGSGGGGGGPALGKWPKEVQDTADAMGSMLEDIVYDLKNLSDPSSGSGHEPAVAEQLEQRIPTVKKKILQFAAPHDVGASKNMTEELGKAKDLIAGNEDYALGETKAVVRSDWEGDAAKNFSEFIAKMMDATQQHKDILSEFKTAVDIYHDSADAVCKDLLDVVDKYQKALDPGLTAAIDILSVGSFLVAIARPDKTALDIVSAAISGLTAAKSFEATGPVDVCDSFIDALDKLREKADERNGQLVAAFDAIRDHLKDDDIKAIVAPSKPDIISQKAFDPDEFAPKDWDDFKSANNEVSTEPLVDTKSE